MTDRPTALRGIGSPSWGAVAALLLLCFAIRLPLLSSPGFAIDEKQFVTWSYQSIQGGIAAPYDVMPGTHPPRRWCNYPPVYLYVLAALGRLLPLLTGGAHSLDQSTWLSFVYGAPTAATSTIHALFKLPALLADAMTCALLFRWLARRATGDEAADSQAARTGGHSQSAVTTAWCIAALYAVSPTILWDSLVWGQVDSIHTLFLLLSLQAAWDRRTAAMSAWAVVAILTKPHSFMLAPLWAACIVRELHAGAWNELRRAAWIATILVVALAGPFAAAGVADGVAESLFGAVGRYPFTHLNGFSLWFLLNPLERPMLGMAGALYQSDTAALLGLPAVTPRAAGLLLLGSVALLVFFRVLRDPPRRSLGMAARLLPLAFFVLPTQIHERYLFPAVALWAWSWGTDARTGNGLLPWWIGWAALHTILFINMVWVFPGPAGWFAEGSFATFLHGSIGGRPIGWWCAAGLLILMAASLRRGEVEHTERARP